MPEKDVFKQEFLSLVRGIEHDIQSLTASTETQDAFMEAVSRSAEINVYGAYTPAEYERRGADGGGIADKDNYEVHTDALQKSDTAFTAGMRLYNNTKGNPKYQWSEGWDDDFITDIIESGHGYHWKRSEIYQMNLPRPFMEQGLDDFVDGYLTQKLDELLR